MDVTYYVCSLARSNAKLHHPPGHVKARQAKRAKLHSPTPCPALPLFSSQASQEASGLASTFTTCCRTMRTLSRCGQSINFQ